MHVCCTYMYKCMYKFHKFEKKEKSIVKQKLSNIQYIRAYIRIPSRLTLLTPMKTRTNVARDTVLPSPGKIKRSKGRKKNHLLEGRKKTLGIDKRVDRKREKEKMDVDGGGWRDGGRDQASGVDSPDLQNLCEGVGFSINR